MSQPSVRIASRLLRERPSVGSEGQTLVEFALVFPVFMLLVIAVIEFAFVFSGMLGISYATRDAALLAAEAGSSPGADCVIIKAVDQAVSPPADDSRIQAIVIYRADLNGVEIPGASNTWTRGASSSCPDGTTVPYARQTNGYPRGRTRAASPSAATGSPDVADARSTPSACGSSTCIAG